ncbi:succinate dehydrogenase subunit [Wolffia australiana]
MAEGVADRVKQHIEEVKEHWRRNLSVLDYSKKVLGRDEPLPAWTDADIEEFIASDPVYGPQLRTAMKSKKFATVGALIGAAHLSGIALKYSKSPHGVVLAGAFGAACGLNFGLEAANHWYKLYKINPAEAHLRFFYWWEDKTANRDF